MTPDEYLRWADEVQPDEPSIQSVISLIRLAPHDMQGRAWLMDEVVPVLYQRHLSTALCRIAQQPGRAYGVPVRPPLVRVAFDMICEVILQGERRQMAWAADSEK